MLKRVGLMRLAPFFACEFSGRGKGATGVRQSSGSIEDSEAPELHDATCGGRFYQPENARGRASFRLGHS